MIVENNRDTFDSMIHRIHIDSKLLVDLSTCRPTGKDNKDMTIQ